MRAVFISLHVFTEILLEHAFMDLLLKLICTILY